MITEKVIDTLYRKYRKRPSSPDELDIDLLFGEIILFHDIAIDDDANLVVNSIPPQSPFHKIPLSNIHTIIEFEHKVAIVMHSSIIFLNKTDSKFHIHIKNSKQSFLDKIFCRDNA